MDPRDKKEERPEEGEKVAQEVNPERTEDQKEELDRFPGWPDIDFKKNLGCGG